MAIRDLLRMVEAKVECSLMLAFEVIEEVSFSCDSLLGLYK